MGITQPKQPHLYSTLGLRLILIIQYFLLPNEYHNGTLQHRLLTIFSPHALHAHSPLWSPYILYSSSWEIFLNIKLSSRQLSNKKSSVKIFKAVLKPALCPEFSSHPPLPSPPLCLDQVRGGDRKDAGNKVDPNCCANFYIGPQCIRTDHCDKLMLAGFRLHRNYASSFNMALILTI